MPIYGYGIIKAPWEIVNKMNITSLTKFIKIFSSEMNIMRKKNPIFIRSINLNIRMDETFIATYDYSKIGYTEYQYQSDMEALIEAANKRINNPNYKFDITGSFTSGKVILMHKK